MKISNGFMLWALICVLLGSTEVKAESIRFLHRLILENDTTQAYSENSGLVVELYTETPERLLKTVNFAKASLNRGHITIHLDRYVPLNVAHSDRFNATSFLIDYDAPMFADIEAEIRSKYGAKPSAEELSGFTHHLLQKTMDRIYDAASTVLSNKRGDCSEHAVLLTALLRKYEIPASVIHGAVLFFDKTNRRWSAFGHAWVEYLDGPEWKGLDPALNRSANKNYIANYALLDESYSFSFGFMNQQFAIGIRKLKIKDQYTIEP